MTKLQRIYRAIRETSTLSKEDARHAAIHILELNLSDAKTLRAFGKASVKLFPKG